MKSNSDRIQELKTNGYKINFEDVINIAFDNYKKIVVYAGLLLDLSSLLLFNNAEGKVHLSSTRN